MRALWMRIFLGVALLTPSILGAQTSSSAPQATPAPTPQPSTQPSATPTQPPATSQERSSVEIRINDKEMEERLNQVFNDPEFERRIERQIERIGDRVDPNQWSGIAALALLVPLSGTAMICLIAWLIYRRSRERMQARMDLHTQLLGKFNSGAEFTAFLSSPGGQQFIESLSTQQSNTPARIIRNTWIGYLLTAMGAGLTLVHVIQGGRLTGGVILLAIGIGYLLSARAARQMLEKISDRALPPNRNFSSPQNPDTPTS